MAVTPDAPRRAGAAVAIDHVAKSYDGRIHALADATLHIAPGEFVLLTGPSGCGKTTLLNLTGALDQPDSGMIVVDGQDLAALGDPVRYRREVVGFVFQTHHLLTALTAEHNVEVPLIAAGVPHRERRERARELLAEVGLGERVDALPAQLSGGERQRVAVARALANRPSLLLADEPTGSLDSEASARVMDLLRTVRDHYGMTILLVSHDPALARSVDRVVRMRDGRIVSSEPAVTGPASPPARAV